MDQVERDSAARTMGYAHEFPHYFDFCTRFSRNSMETGIRATNEGACEVRR